MPSADGFRAQCRFLRWAALGVLSALTLLYALGLVGVPWPLPAIAEIDAHSRWMLRAVVTLPALAYLWALWSVQHALGQLASGALFQDTVARALRRIGAGLLLGALLSVFALTNLTRWILGGVGGYAWFDLSGIVLGVIGAVLILFARLIDQARAFQAELDEIV
jgi:hypothetical protein